jgi:hypothetical protein
MGTAVGRRHLEHGPRGRAVQLPAAPFDPRAYGGCGQGVGVVRSKPLMAGLAVMRATVVMIRLDVAPKAKGGLEPKA